jgi:HlyD family secretion protein
MTVLARFQVTRRTLFQLLFDKADDWLNPNLIPNEH